MGAVIAACLPSGKSLVPPQKPKSSRWSVHQPWAQRPLRASPFGGEGVGLRARDCHGCPGLCAVISESGLLTSGKLQTKPQRLPGLMKSKRELEVFIVCTLLGHVEK